MRRRRTRRSSFLSLAISLCESRAAERTLTQAKRSELAKSIVDHLGNYELVLQLAQIEHSTTTPLSHLYLDFLASLGNVVFSRLNSQYIALEHFHLFDEARSIEEGFKTQIVEKWNGAIDQAIAKTVPPPPPPTSNTPTKSRGQSSPSAGSKRGRDSPESEGNNHNGTESKAAKNARLLKAIGAVNATLSGNGVDIQRIMV